MTLGPVIGRGRTADIFAWERGQVLKLFHADHPVEWSRREAQMTRQAHALGLAAPQVFDEVSLDGRYGIVFERIEGRSMLHTLSAEPWRLVSLARQLADLQAAMHRQRAPALPSWREALARHIAIVPRLDGPTREQLLAALARQPVGDEVVCHGDLHPDNIILAPQGPLVIDWLTATRGPRLADIARTFLLLQYGAPPDDCGPLLRLLLAAFRRQFVASYWRRYRQSLPTSFAELHDWLAIMAASRLLEDRPPAEEKQLLGVIRAWQERRGQPPGYSER
jgi:aminoglycoside phosphotransferase (APT) family kinase protein